jgi:murein DD-endopeptidase MepM/ murein hydrolase activator NlpD
MFRRVVASLGVCSALALAGIGVGGLAGEIPHAWADDNQATPDNSVEALGGASGMTATRREVAKGDTLLDVLINAGSTVNEADRVIVAMADLFSPERLQIGQVVTAVFDMESGSDGARLAAVSLTVDDGGFIVANRTADGNYTATHSDVALEEALFMPLQDQQAVLPGIPAVSRLEVRRGDTLIRLVLRGGAARADAEAAISELRELFDPTKLQVGQSLEMVLLPDQVAGHPMIASLSLSLENGGYVVVERGPDGTFAARQADSPAATDETIAAVDTDIGPFLEQLRDSGAQIERFRIASGDTLMDLIMDAGVTVTDADRAARALAAQYDPHRLQIGQSLYVVQTPGPRSSGLYVLGLVVLDAGDDGLVIARRDTESGDFAGHHSVDALDVAMLATLLGQPLSHDAADAVQFEQGTSVETLKLERGDTMMALLLRAGAARVEADRAIRAMRRHIDPQRLQIGQEIRVVFDPAGAEDRQLVAVSVKLGSNDYVQVDRSGDSFVGRRTTVALNPALSTPTPAPFMSNDAPIDVTDLEVEDETVVAAYQPDVDTGASTPHMPPVTEAEAEAILSSQAAQYWFEIRPTDSLPALLRMLTQNGKEIDAVIDIVGENYDLNELSEGQQLVAITDEDGAGTHIIAISLDTAGDDTIVVVRQRDGGYDLRHAAAHVDLSDFHIADSVESPETAAIAAVWPDAPSGLAVETTTFGSGDTLMDSLIGMGVAAAEAQLAVTALGEVFNPRHIRAGQDLDVLMHDGSLYGMMLHTAPGERVDVALTDGDYTARMIELPLIGSMQAARGVIETSLYQAAIDAGVPPSVLQDMIRAYSFDVDFQREIQSGDSFALLYEEFLDEDGNAVRYGAPTYAVLDVSGATLPIYRYTPASGFADYFNDKGESVRKALLRTPVDGARITSGFGMRDHPLLGYSRMHKGVDFGAAAGTPIMAAGDGVIDFIGRNNGYGNYIRIRHNSTYSTAYAHMQGFASGLGQGSHVRQGQVIGYVGTTGMSTGPHLHYEVLVNNEQINPLDVKLPSGEKLAGTELAAFLDVRDALDQQYAELLSEKYVAGSQ